MRKVVMLTAELSDRYGMSDWRQHAYNVTPLAGQIPPGMVTSKSPTLDERLTVR
jgi:hypothetical protein